MLSANWRWAPALLDEGAVRELAEGFFAALGALARHVRAAGRWRAEPERSAAAGSDAKRDRTVGERHRGIEDILPLSPLQEGLLFHALYDAQGPDVYTVQLELELEGALDAGVFEASIQGVIGRHASLRAGFVQEHLRRPVQVVLARAAAPWRLIDLSHLDELAQQDRLAAILEADRPERFDLQAPPLMRFALIRLAAERHRLLISNHHLLMDGWWRRSWCGRCWRLMRATAAPLRCRG